MSTKNNTPFPDCLKIPLVVGVSGHIDILTPESEVAKRMAEFWEGLRELAGPETPIILLSSIAAGADHLAVKYRPPDVKYCVVLPFKKEVYRMDFSGEALIDFENDYENADNVIDCDATPGDYAVASDYVRKHSDVLLTLWDGYESLVPHTSIAKKGGTYYQILAAFHLKTPPLEFKEKVHLVVNLSVMRKKEPPERHREAGEKNVGGFSDACSLTVLKWDKPGSRFVAADFSKFSKSLFVQDETKTGSDPSEETTNVIPNFAVILKRIREHNEHLPTEPRKGYYLRNDIESEIEQEKANGIHTTETCFKLIEADFLRLEYFDGLAEKHQRPFRKQFKWIAIGSFLVGILGQAWGDIIFWKTDDCIEHEAILHGVILCYLLGCLALYVYYRKTKKDANYFKYVRPRLIAEMLRLKIFWRLAGIRESFSDCFLEECAGYWFMLTVCNWELWDAPLSDSDKKWLDAGNGLASVKKFWLEDQDKYYAGYLLKNPKSFIVPEEGEKCRRIKFLFHPLAWRRAYFNKYERCEGYAHLLKRFFVGLAFIFSICFIIVFVSGQIRKPGSLCHKKFWCLEHYREFIVGICPFIVALLGWMMEKHPWGQIALQYRKALSLFRKTETYLEEDHPDSDKRQMIKELILYAHHENAEWNDIRNGAKPEPMI